MSELLEINITGDTQAVARFSSMSDRVRASIRDAMQREWYGLQAAVVTEKLSGDPLHRRTGVLASSIAVGGSQTASEFTETPAQMVGKVGTNVFYGRIHESGGTFNVPEHTRTGGLSVKDVFVAGRSGFREIMVRAHTVTFPERSFLRSALRDRSTQIREAMAKAVHDGLEAV